MLKPPGVRFFVLCNLVSYNESSNSPGYLRPQGRAPECGVHRRDPQSKASAEKAVGRKGGQETQLPSARRHSSHSARGPESLWTRRRCEGLNQHSDWSLGL